MRKIIFKTLIIFGVLLLLLLIGWLITKHVLTRVANNKAEDFIESTYKRDGSITYSDDTKIFSLTETVFNNFDTKDPSDVLFLRIRGYVTNERLPLFLRLEGGVIETIVQKGLCDNAARMLSFILKKAGYESVQWNMVGKSLSGHSALVVSMQDKRKAYVDPIYGYVAMRNDKLIGPVAAQDEINEGVPIESVFRSFEGAKHQKHYDHFNSAFMSAEGDVLVIEDTIPKIGTGALIIGEINGQSTDVMRGARLHNMTSYWHYIGHKYNREWIRTLTAHEPVRIEMSLVDEPEEAVITSNVQPEVVGKKLIWTLKENEKLIFKDGDATISFKRLNSYIDVDQIIFYRI